ncbi:MAG: peptidyl-prolyl cis-trans isomerase [Desulfobulbaceae bacterium]|nr:peptidyl-prolyl cis-trans isomerase [Desulfobulbaceae bacterium]
MRRLIYGTICFLFFLAPSVPSFGGWLPWSDNTLVTIDDKKYNAGDFRSWWSNWQEPGMSFPESPDSFIDWMLLVNEAEKMRLYEDPGYRKKVLTFLKARTLMLLKAEEVDSRISLSDNELWERYQEIYAPLYQLNILFFNSREDARSLLDEIGPGPISDEQTAELAEGETGPEKVETEWYRKVSVDPGWHDIIEDLKQGELSDPVDWKKGVVILRLQELKKGERDDFAAVRREIRDTLRKERANLLTMELLRDLREKYNVRVDSERLEELDISAADNNFSDQPIVTTDHGTISEKDFMMQVRRMQKFRRESGFGKKDDAYRYKEQVLNGIIDQTLTSWESLARGYEKQSPFKEIYEFYCQNRMIKALENRLFFSQAEVTPEEVNAYYEEHIEDFSRPEIVRMVSIEGHREMINSLWTQVAMGSDLRSSALERFDLNLPVRDMPVDHLSQEMQAVVNKLTKGEVSPVFDINGHASLVQLVERIPAQPSPLAKVGHQIRDQLFTERLDRIRSEYVDRLRAGSSITVNDGVWKQLKKEMEQADAEKTRK